jgi:hypothetical protein
MTTQGWSDRCVSRRVAEAFRAKADKLDRQDKPEMAAGLREDADALDRLSLLSPQETT